MQCIQIGDRSRIYHFWSFFFLIFYRFLFIFSKIWISEKHFCCLKYNPYISFKQIKRSKTQVNIISVTVHPPQTPFEIALHPNYKLHKLQLKLDHFANLFEKYKTDHREQYEIFIWARDNKNASQAQILQCPELFHFYSIIDFRSISPKAKFFL